MRHSIHNYGTLRCLGWRKLLISLVFRVTPSACYPIALMRKHRVALLFLLFLGCGKLNEITAPGGGGEPVDETATFTRVQTEIFTPTCTGIGCHHTLGAQEGLVLLPGQSFGNIVNRPSQQMPSLRRVNPGDFANSYLYRKITGVGITGDKMPQGGPYLTDVQIKLVRDWIRRGAPND
jgi:hypothetical protein